MATVDEKEIPHPDQTMPERAARTLKTLRWWMVVPLPVLIIIASSFGPDGWREPAERLLWFSWVCLFAAAAHGLRRYLFPSADFSEAWKEAMGGNIAASILVLSIKVFTALVLIGLISYAKAQNVRTYIPANAELLLPILKDTQQGYWPDHVAPSYFGALIEHESCISLTHSKCWNPKARLKTEREEGASLGQFTRAWKSDGSLRFDAIAEVRAMDPEALREFTWSTVYSRADLSMKAIMVKQRDCYRRVLRLAAFEPMEVIHFCDSAYNGGFGGMQTDRRLCAEVAGCDPNKWFGHVEKYSLKSKQKWQGYGKSAFEINRHHVYDVLFTRRPKYMAALGPDQV